MNFKLCSVNYLLRCLQRFYFILFFSSFKIFVLLCLSSVSGRDMLIIRISCSPNFVILRGKPDLPIAQSQEDNYYYVIHPLPPKKSK